MKKYMDLDKESDFDFTDVNNGKDLAWSKVVLLRNRMYATTKEECTEMFNEYIQDKIN